MFGMGYFTADDVGSEHQSLKLHSWRHKGHVNGVLILNCVVCIKNFLFDRLNGIFFKKNKYGRSENILFCITCLHKNMTYPGIYSPNLTLDRLKESGVHYVACEMEIWMKY